MAVWRLGYLLELLNVRGSAIDAQDEEVVNPHVQMEVSWHMCRPDFQKCNIFEISLIQSFENCRLHSAAVAFQLSKHKSNHNQRQMVSTELEPHRRPSSFGQP